MRSYVLLLVALVAVVNAKIFFHEAFDKEDAFDHWTQSAKSDTYGKFKVTSGDFYGDAEINRGLKTSEDAKFYSASTEIPGEGVTNKDSNLVVSLSVKHEQGIDCGGGYIKITPAMDAKNFHGESEYFMMFGPDVCGYTRKVHLIFNYKGENHLWKKEPRFPDDKLTHVYTVVVKPDNTYELYIDMELKESGNIEDDWKLLKDKEIDDPADSKPADWVDEADIDDPEDKKPEDWDAEPETIVGPEAKQPEDWDTEEDGEWEAPRVPNPKFKGEWRAKRIPNPAYKGVWKAKRIANPAYEADSNLYLIPKPLKHVGIDIWQVKAGSVFDNIIIGDDLTEVNAIIEKTWKATKDAEKAAEEKSKPAAAEEPKGDDKAEEEDEKEDL